MDTTTIKTESLTALAVSKKTNSPKYSLIWLHGLGAFGEDFVPMIEELNTKSTDNIKFIFPDAPFKEITINDGMLMRAWFDIKNLEFEKEEDEEGIKDSQELIYQLIEHEKQQGVPAKNIILGGFSQGGAMALYAGLRYPEKLKAIISLSAYMPLLPSFEEEKNSFNDMNIFIAHGMFDPVVPYMYGQKSFSTLKDMEYKNLEWTSLQIQHTVSEDELLAIGKFIEKICE